MKPIGTEYTEVWPADLFSTDPCPHKATYRVVAHHGEAEEVECIAIEPLPAPTFIPPSALTGLDKLRTWHQEYASQFEDEV